MKAIVDGKLVDLYQCEKCGAMVKVDKVCVCQKPKNPYSEYSAEELEGMLDHPEEIETGCELNCDGCLEEEIKKIKEAIEWKLTPTT